MTTNLYQPWQNINDHDLTLSDGVSVYNLSGGETMSAGNYETGTEAPAVVLRIDILGKQLEELAMAINGLDARLQPVLKPPSQVAKDEGETKQPRFNVSPLSEKLDDRIKSIHWLRERIKDIQTRLEV